MIDLSRERAHELLHQMIRIRRFEESCAEYYSAGKIRGFLHLCIGQEAVAVGTMQTLASQDAVTATYREHGHALARGVSMRRVLAEMFGRAAGCSRGRGGSMHLFDAATRFYGGHAIVAGGLPLAVGLGLAEQFAQRSGLSVCFFGEGATNEGEFHEALNLAALWRVPVLFVCENNGYAMGTAHERSLSQVDLCRHARAYGIEAEAVDGMDVTAVRDVADRLGTAARSDGPRFMECHTYRFRAHSMFDPELYRDKAEVEAWKKRGPIVSFTARLRRQDLLTTGELEFIEANVGAEIEGAVTFADSAEPEAVEDLMRDIYGPRPGA